MTTQLPDRFLAAGLWNGTTFGNLPKGEHPRLKYTEEIYVHDNYMILNMIDSTACRRGYVATWLLRDSSLYLTDIVGHYHMIGKGPVHADWYSGLLFVMHGELITEEFYPHDPVHEHCMVLEFSLGLLQGRLDWGYDSTNDIDPFLQFAMFSTGLVKINKT